MVQKGFRSMSSKLEVSEASALAGADIGPKGRNAAYVSIRGVSRYYGSVAALNDVSLDIRRGELLSLLGPSGSGKTTLLRLLAGLDQPTSGSIAINGKDITGIPTQLRNVGVVFQALALFPHLSVEGNIAFPLWMRRTGKKEIKMRVQSALDLVRLPNIGSRRVDELSGGQRQRVALARALVYEPELLLLDEPLAALDAKLREEMQLEIIRLHDEVGATIVNVTHDQKEAMAVSDRIALMNDAKLEQVGAPEEVYRTPKTSFSVKFLGKTNAFIGEVVRDSSDTVLALRGGGSLLLREGASEGLTEYFVRAEDVRLSRRGADTQCRGTGKIVLKVYQGSLIEYEIQVAGASTRVVAQAASDEDSGFVVGDSVDFNWGSDRAIRFERDPSK